MKKLPSLTTNWVISQISKSDILKGSCPYIRKGKLYFDALVIKHHQISLVHKGKTLATCKIPPIPPLGSITFQLDDSSSLKISITCGEG